MKSIAIGNRCKPSIARFLRRLDLFPGVSSSGLINALPLSRNQNVSGFYVEGYANQEEQLVQDAYTTPQYFAAMETPIVKGRAFTTLIRLGSPWSS